MEMDEDIRLLQRLVAIPSVSGAEQAIGDAVEAEFRNMGLEVERYEIGNGRPVVLGILRGGRPGPALLFDGHTDTHPVEDYLGDPFEPRIEDGRLYGRGSVDMKGGLAAMMRAAGRLKSCREKLAGSLIVAAVPDEELLSQGTAFLAELGVKAQAGIVGEPTGLKIGRAMRGVTHIDLTVTGTPKHTSSWSGDENAIVQMGKILAALDRELPERYELSLIHISVTASSSVIGPIIPPSIGMVLYGATLGTSISAMFMGGLVPGILLGLGLMIPATYLSIKRKYPRNTEKYTPKQIAHAFVRAIPALLMPVIILGGILGGVCSPTEAASVAILYLSLIHI